MSGFMFGGSALTLDIGVRNNTVQPVVRGDVLQIDLTQAVDPTSLESTSDGYDAVHCGTADGDIGNYSVTGVVLAPPGKEIGPQEECIIRVMGIADVQGVVGVQYTTGRLMTPSTVTPHATTHVRMTMLLPVVADLSSNATKPDLIAKAVCLETPAAVIPAGGGLVKCWVKGLPL